MELDRYAFLYGVLVKQVERVVSDVFDIVVLVKQVERVVSDVFDLS